MDKSSLSLLANKSSMHLVACRMNPGVAPSAVDQGKQSVPEIVATGHNAKCSLQYVPSVAKKRKYLSSLTKIDRCIVVNATKQSD